MWGVINLIRKSNNEYIVYHGNKVIGKVYRRLSSPTWIAEKDGEWWDKSKSPIIHDSTHRNDCFTAFRIEYEKYLKEVNK